MESAFTAHTFFEFIGLATTVMIAGKLLGEGAFWYTVRRAKAELELEKAKAEVKR